MEVKEENQRGGLKIVCPELLAPLFPTLMWEKIFHALYNSQEWSLGMAGIGNQSKMV